MIDLKKTDYSETRPFKFDSGLVYWLCRQRFPKMFRVSLRSFSTAARQSLKIGLIPADGVGKEVIPVCSFQIHAACQSHHSSAGSKRGHHCFRLWYSEARIHRPCCRLGVLYAHWCCTSWWYCSVRYFLFSRQFDADHRIGFSKTSVTVRYLDRSGMYDACTFS